MTPGQEALAEAARLESARHYGRTIPEHRQADRPMQPSVHQAVAAGWATTQIMTVLGYSYADVQDAREARAELDRQHGARRLRVVS